MTERHVPWKRKGEDRLVRTDLFSSPRRTAPCRTDPSRTHKDPISLFLLGVPPYPLCLSKKLIIDLQANRLRRVSAAHSLK